MISIAYGRYSGPTLRGSARFVFLCLVSALLLACRHPTNEHLLHGVALGTGYHVTLYASLDSAQLAVLEAGIQGELTELERQRSDLLRLGSGALLPLGLALPDTLWRELDRWFQALAVDRLTQWLATHDSTQAVMVELGGIQRGQGDAPGGAWHLSLEQVGLPTLEEAHRIALKDAALVQHFVSRDFTPLISLEQLLAVSVIAEDASTALYLASLLTQAGPDRALRLASEMDSAVKIIVKTPKGIEIHHTVAIEPLLEN